MTRGEPPSRKRPPGGAGPLHPCRRPAPGPPVRPGPTSDPALLLFESATLVFWAEEVAGEGGIPVEVVPAPAGLRDLCGLALQTPFAHLPALKAALQAEGIPYRLHG